MSLPKDPAKRFSYLENLSLSAKKRKREKHSSETITKMRESALESWQNPEIRERRIKADKEAGQEKQAKADTPMIRLLSACSGLRTFRDFVKKGCQLFSLPYVKVRTKLLEEMGKRNIERLDIVIFMFYGSEGKSVETCAFKIGISTNIFYQRLEKLQKVYPGVFKLKCFRYIPDLQSMWRWDPVLERYYKVRQKF